jgi:glutamine synthetase
MSESQYVLLGMPDMNGSLRGKALSTDAFDSAVKEGTVMTDLLLGLDPVDTPIATYEDFGIRSGAGDLVVRPETDTLHPLVA